MISVVLAVRNGDRTLPAVLDRHAALLPAPVPHRFVAVDNASTDATPALLRAAADRLPLTLLHAPEPGKNRALNTAMAEALPGAELVVFTDDDALPDPEWLRRLWAAAVARPGYAVFGGAIRPRWPAPPPRWLFDWGVPLGVVYAATDKPEGPVGADNVWGPNMAVRGALLRQGHRFDEGVGPDGSASYAMGSETEFTVRLERAGHRAWFVADATVEHVVRAEQLTEEWVLSRAYRHGRGVYRYVDPPGTHVAKVRGVPVDMELRRAAYAAAARAARRVPWPSARRFWWIWKAEWLRGATEALRVGAAGPAPAGPGPPQSEQAVAPPSRAKAPA